MRYNVRMDSRPKPRRRIVYTWEFLRLCGLAEKWHKTFLDAYGATNEAEFFAVDTEEFFDRPVALQGHAPDLYRVLKAYYCHAPVGRVQRADSHDTRG